MKQFRIATLALSAAGVFFNTIIIISQLVLLWHVFNGEPVSEREGTEQYMVEAGLALWVLFLLYLMVSTGLCLVAFIAAMERCPARLKAVKHACFIDVCLFAAGLLAFLLFAGSHLPEIQSFVCEELSRQPRLMFDALDVGLTYESCEVWTTRGLISIATFMALTTLVKVQYVLTLTSYHYQLLRSIRINLGTSPKPLGQLLLLSNQHSVQNENDFIVYAPVELTADEARGMYATEAWAFPSDSFTDSTLRGMGSVHLPIGPEEGLISEQTTKGQL